jgi:hypothetical protein
MKEDGVCVIAKQIWPYARLTDGFNRFFLCPGMPTQASRWDQGPSYHPGLCGAWYMCASDFWHDLLVLPVHQTVKDVFDWAVNWMYIFHWLYRQTVGVWHLRFSLSWTPILWSCRLRHWRLVRTCQCFREEYCRHYTVSWPSRQRHEMVAGSQDKVKVESHLCYNSICIMNRS